MHRFTSATLVCAALLAGCSITDSGDDIHCADGKCDGGEDRCFVEDRYANGTCDTDCAQADPDCFLMFGDQPQANTWFSQLETKLAMQEVRAPRSTVAPTDSRFQRMRELLDRGWESYRKVMPVRLLEQAPELVVIDDPTPNAFVARDVPSGKAAWVVMVQTGAMEGQPDHALLGVVMHELTHATKLHILPDIPERTRIHYQIKPGELEPIGAHQRDNLVARAAITAWRDLGEDAGSSPYAELNGMPYPGSLLSTMMNAAISKVNISTCTQTVASVQQLNAFMAAHTHPLTGLLALTTAADRARLDQLTKTFLGHLRNECLANVQIDLFELMAQHFGVTAEQIAEEFPAAEQAAVAGKHVLDQITYLAGDRHRRMREIAALLQQDTGRDITTLRYFSTEEDADDSTVPVLRDMGLPADGVGQFFNVLMPEGARGACDELLAAGTTPPYGDLVDEHHATCWRISHVRQLVTLQGGEQTFSAALPEPAHSLGAYRAIAGGKLPRWRRAKDETSLVLHGHGR